MRNASRRSTVSQQKPIEQAHNSGESFAARKPPHFQYQISQDPLILPAENPVESKKNTICKPIL